MLRSAQGVTFLPDSPRLLIFIFDAFAPFDAFLVQGFVFSWDRFQRRACLGNQGLGEENS